ncbi:hypothetical protein AMECASPLE_011767 [Ameca splendens]|uniref:Uncharacterized protein n=1 Tax=Ameca splendens TaxID=208324 RepID=A0ABV0YPA6_9TELE
MPSLLSTAAVALADKDLTQRKAPARHCRHSRYQCWPSTASLTSAQPRHIFPKAHTMPYSASASSSSSSLQSASSQRTSRMTCLLFLSSEFLILNSPWGSRTTCFKFLWPSSQRRKTEDNLPLISVQEFYNKDVQVDPPQVPELEFYVKVVQVDSPCVPDPELHQGCSRFACHSPRSL